MQHDDMIGEEGCQEEAEDVQKEIVSAIMGPAACELRFPGSQPVSLAASNTHLLSKHRYYVTWKADGTRYMLYISVLGTYLVDRSFSVRRVQMRWPTAAPKTKLQYDPEVPQHGTLLDGEMIVDEDKATGKQARRYLAYDIMQLCGRPLRNATFKVRHAAFFLIGNHLFGLLLSVLVGCLSACLQSTCMTLSSTIRVQTCASRLFLLHNSVRMLAACILQGVHSRMLNRYCVMES